MRTYYEILGVAGDAPPEIIKAAYKAWMIALRVHPDLGGDEELAKEINVAYDVLGDRSKRAAYDEKLAAKMVSVPREMRRSPRFRVDARVAFYSPSHETWNGARAKDASSYGLKIATEKYVKAGEHITVAFENSAKPSVEAKVKWVEVIHDGTLEFGCEFFSAVPDILERLGLKQR